MFGKKYSMDLHAADNTLQNVFAACNQKPNKVPFDKIVSRSRQNLFSDNLFILLSIVLLLVTFFLPLCFPYGDFLMSASPSVNRSLSVEKHSLTTKDFTISFSGSVVDAGATYMEDEAGNKYLPLQYTRSNNTLIFPFYGGECNLYVYDIDGKCLHLLLCPRK